MIEMQFAIGIGRMGPQAVEQATNGPEEFQAANIASVEMRSGANDRIHAYINDNSHEKNERKVT